MKLLVKKFGGTTLADVKKIAKIATLLINEANRGYQIIAVVSAMGDTTDDLLTLAKPFETEKQSRELDVLLASGEQISVALLTMALLKQGHKAKSYLAWQIGIVTEGSHTSANITAVNTALLRQDLSAGYITVVAGFQGVDSDGNVTTLGRGGSDATAVAIAAAMQADECQIYTDVDGVYTVDPAICPDAHLLDTVHVTDMLEMSSMGANVLQLHSVALAERNRVPVRVLNAFSETQSLGSQLLFHRLAPTPLVTGFAVTKALALFNFSLANTLLYQQLLRYLEEHALPVDMWLIGQDHVQFALPADVASLILPSISDKFTVTLQTGLARLAVIGQGLLSNMLVIPRILQVLYAAGVQVHLMNSAEIKVSLLIDEKDLERSVKLLHNSFIV
jgi:aspartate kinase